MAKMEEMDKEQFLQITDKYNMTSIIDEYPEWLINDVRNRILQECRFLVRNIIQANSIFPCLETECDDRRRYQTAAIGNCEQLLQELQYLISVIDVDLNKFMPYVDLIEKEIALLKAWRKSDNRLRKRVYNEQKNQYIERLGDIIHDSIGENGLAIFREIMERDVDHKLDPYLNNVPVILESITTVLKNRTSKQEIKQRTPDGVKTSTNGRKNVSSIKPIKQTNV
jgi:hypothetical protein